jgi:serine/threonine protein kinase
MAGSLRVAKARERASPAGRRSAAEPATRMAMNPAQAIDEEGGPTSVQRSHAQALPIGTRLRDYEITVLVGEGAFSVVYLAWDHSLQRKVAIKEYFPAEMASRVSGSAAVLVRSDRQRDVFKAGLKAFVDEARLLARFDHPSLLKVYRFWEENGTAYMVMPFYAGPTLKTALAELGRVPGENELRAWLKPVLNAVTVLHEGKTWHEHIGPDAIVLTPVGPVLLGFASAEHAIAAMNHTPAAALLPGYAAIEQYGGVAETTRGPWTDLYALAAVVYAAITGADPAPAADRLADDRLQPLSTIAAGLYSANFLAAIDAALAVQPERRPRDHVQFRSLMGDIDTPERVELAPPLDLMQEPFLGGVASTREITVPDPPVPAAPVPVAAPAASDAKAGPRAATSEPTPSWMSASRARALFGKRAIYGLVAATGALIGIAALALQFYARQGPRPAIATAPAASALERPAVAAATRPTPFVPAPSTAASPAAPRAATVATVAVPAQPTPALIAKPAAPIAASAPSAELAPIATPAERQARCLEILQKASLERISAAETSFFKKECK